MSSNSVCNHTRDKKCDFRCVIVRFCYHSYDCKLNRAPLCPFIIINFVQMKKKKMQSPFFRIKGGTEMFVTLTSMSLPLHLVLSFREDLSENCYNKEK